MVSLPDHFICEKQTRARQSNPPVNFLDAAHAYPRAAISRGRDREHHHVVEKQIRPEQQRACCEGRGLQRVIGTAAPQHDHADEDGPGHHPLQRPRQLLAAAQGARQAEHALQLIGWRGTALCGTSFGADAVDDIPDKYCSRP